MVMITGDSAFTAIEVGRKLGMTQSRPSLILQQSAGGGPAEWLVLKDKQVDIQHTTIPFAKEAIRTLAESYNLCVTGPGLQCLTGDLNKVVGGGTDVGPLLKQLCPLVSVFARVSPHQKEVILQALNDAGGFTLMCGDGTNDVGALKAAHVGVSVVNDPDLEKKIDDHSSESLGNKKTTSSQSRKARALAELQVQEMDPTIVKLGDASIASPFTARRTSIDCILTVIRQGRCTLVTTIQVFDDDSTLSLHYTFTLNQILPPCYDRCIRFWH